MNATTSNPLFFLVDKYPKRISIKKTVTIHLAFPPFLSILKVRQKLVTIKTLKVHKREKFFGSDFEFFTIL